MKKYCIPNTLKRGGFFMLLFLYFSPIAQGQSYNEIIHQLEKELQEHPLEDTQRVNLLNELSYAYRRNNPVKIDSFAKVALQLAEQLEYTKGKGIAYKNLGIAQYKLNGSLENIIKLYKEAIHWSTKATDYYTQVACLNNLALCYSGQLAFEKAIATLQEALRLHHQYLPEDRLRTLLYGNIGDTYVTLEDFKNAQKYYEELVKIAERLKDEKTVLIHVETQALLLSKLNQPTKALKLIEESLPRLKAFEDYQSLVKIQVVLSEILLEKGAYRKAYQVLNQAQENLEAYNLKVEQCRLYLNLSKVHLAENKIVDAKEIGNAALTCAKANRDDYIKLITVKHLIQVYLADNDAFKAAEFFNQYDQLYNEYTDLQKQKAYIKTEIAYQVKNKEAENAILLAKQRENEATIQSQKIFNTSLIMTAAFSLILGFLAITAYLQKQKQNKILDQKVSERTKELNQSNQELVTSNIRLEESNKQLERFAYIASHDLKQPLSTIVNFSKLLAKVVAQNSNPEHKLYLKHIQESGKRMLSLIEDVLEFSRLDKGKHAMENIDLNQLVEEIKIMLDAYLVERNALIQINQPLPSIMGDRIRLLIIFKNLIENGIKYNTSNQPIIQIASHQTTDYIKLSFTDNGIGIQEQYHHKIFQMFSRLQNHKDYEGTGLGLSICKKIINSMGGIIGIDPEVQKGSLFYFKLPFGESAIS